MNQVSNRCRKERHKDCDRYVSGNPPKPCKCECHEKVRA